jgi:hypothetical protein
MSPLCAAAGGAAATTPRGFRLRCCGELTVTGGSRSADCAEAVVTKGGSSEVAQGRAGEMSAVVAARMDRRRLVDVLDMSVSM